MRWYERNEFVDPSVRCQPFADSPLFLSKGAAHAYDIMLIPLLRLQLARMMFYDFFFLVRLN